MPSTKIKLFQNKLILSTALILFYTLQGLIAQEAKTDWSMRWSGFIKTDVFYDSRQSSAGNGIREGHFYLFPDNILLDAEGKDVNANGSFHILNIQSRLRMDISGPQAFGAATSAAIEGEFFGTTETDLNGFRLRHAYAKFEWEKTNILIGQFWHPMFPAENFPGTISFNTGAPFTPFSRNPQLRIGRKLGSTTLSLTAYSQRDFSSTGPEGSSNKYMRNSKRPGFNLQVKLPAGEDLTAWLGMDHKTLRPELISITGYAADATISSLSAFGSLLIKTKPLNISLMGVYAQNATDLVMLGGYAELRVTDSLRMSKEYTNLSTANILLDLSTTGKKHVFGLFMGYSKNLGASAEFEGKVYARGSNIDHLMRVSPRVMITEGKISFAAEIEHTIAAYGKMQKDGKVTDTKEVSNWRILLSSIYRF